MTGLAIAWLDASIVGLGSLFFVGLGVAVDRWKEHRQWNR